MDKKPPETSSEPYSTSKFNFLIALFCGLLILAHFISSFFPKSRLWGINHLAYFPMWVRLLFTLPGLLILIPWVNSRVYRLLEQILSFFQRILPKKEVLTASILAVVSIFFFWLLRTRTYFLGDGLSYLSFLGSDVLPTHRIGFEPLELLTHFYLYKFLRVFFAPSPEFIYISLSILAGGVFVFILFFLTKTVSENKFDRLFAFSILLFSGATQLFLGYVEHYTLMYLSVFSYLFFSLRYLQGKGKILLPIFFCILSISFHFSSVYLLPSLFFLFTLKRKKGESVFDIKKALRYLFIPVFVLVLAIFYVWIMNPAILDIFVPIFKGRLYAPEYTLFSFPHILDVFNQHLLLSPAGIILLISIAAAYKRTIKSTHPIIIFFITVSFAQFVYHFSVDPKLLALRDWDLFSAVGIGYTLLGVYLFISSVQVKKYSAVVLVFTCILCTLPWFLLNANEGKAIARFKDFLDSNPKWSHSGRTVLIDYYKKHGRFEEAEKCQAEIFRIFPEDSLTRASETLIDQGHYDRAMTLLKKAIEMNPNATDAHNDLGLVYSELGRTDDALEEFQKVLQVAPSYPAIHLNLGYAYLDKGRLEEALEELKKGVKLGGASAEVFNNLAFVYRRLGETERAIEELKKSIKMDPKFVPAHFSLGQVYLQNQRLDEALIEFLEVQRLKPDYYPVYYSLGMVYAYKGMKDKAIEELQLFLKYAKNPAEIQKAQGLIQQLSSQKP
jgi:tetratricopeptide (TPR) repeat protein